MRDARLVRAVLVALLLPCSGLLADSAWTIPGIVNANGLNGTHFVSDLTLTNPGTVAANVTLSFFPPGASSAKNLTLNPGQTVVYADVAGVTFGVSGGAGALSISSDQPLLVRAKTYNSAQSGTYGVALPVVAADRLLSPGDVADSLWITQDASGAAGYRTNVAVVFPDDSGGEATVTVYDADGNQVGSQDFSLDAPGLQQFSVGSFAGAVPVGRAQVQVIRGRAAGYSVVVDNVTGDSSLFAFEQLPAGWQDVLVNGVARANGRNGAFFRTDGRFYNPTDADATIQVAFHASGPSNPSPAAAQFVIPAGKIRDVVDVLDSLLSLPVGSAGALRFQSSSPVAILCRTSNVDPSGARPGTFGSQQKPVPLLSFVNSADAGAAVTGIRQDAAFRTNVGFAAGADGASYTLTLQNASGATVATTSASLGAFGWTQPGIQDLFPTTTIPQNAALQVKVTAGSVDVFDSSIDNLSGDPVVTPIAPLPVAIPSSATIGPQGGSIRSDDGVLTIRIPAGALGAPTPMSIATVSNDAPGALGSAYDVSPGGLALAKPALLSLRYGSGGIPVDGIDAVSLAVLGDTGWGGLTGGRVDTSSRSLLIPLRNTSPAAASAAMPMRQTLAGETTRFSAVLSLEVARQDWLPTGGKMTLQVKIRVVQPSSAGDQTTVIPLLPGAAPEDVTWGNPSIGSISSKAGPTVTYTAPPTLKDVFALVKLSVKNFDHATNTVYGISFSFKVIRRQWKLTLHFEENVPCANSPYDVTVQDSQQAFRTLSFDDKMALTVAPPGLDDPGDIMIKTCNPHCTVKITSPGSLLRVNDLAGFFFGDNYGFLLVGTLTETNAVPGYSADCPPIEGGHADLPGIDYTAPVPPPPVVGSFWPLSDSNQTSIRHPTLPVDVWAEWASIP